MHDLRVLLEFEQQGCVRVSQALEGDSGECVELAVARSSRLAQRLVIAFGDRRFHSLRIDQLRESRSVVITRTEVAAALGVDPRTVTIAIESGSIP